MAATDPGPRDHLVTRALERALTALDPEVLDEHPLDPAEAPDRLARHAMAELRVNLDGEDSADAQAERVNAIVRTFADGDEPDAAGRSSGARASRHQGPVAARRRGAAATATGDAVQPERSARQCRGSAQRRLGAARRAGDRRFRRSDLRVRDLVGRSAPSRGARRRQGSAADASASSRRPTWVRRRSGQSTSSWRSVRRSASRSTLARPSCTRRPGCWSAARA